MSVLIVGSTALDSITTPTRSNPRLLGGSASHAGVAASLIAPTQLVGVVGDDFPRKYVELYRRHGIDLEGLKSEPGKTFHWAGEYELNMNRRRTLKTELGVFEHFQPDLPERFRRAPFVLLANIAPQLQHHVLDQVRGAKFVLADTMDLWLNIALKELLALLKRVDALVLNDTEASQLSGQDNVVRAARRIHRLGPRFVIIKKGEHGALLSGPSGLFALPAYPLERVVDPTGAGDSFAGGLMGYLATRSGPVERHLRQAMVLGTIVASFCCEGFGLTRTDRVKPAELARRVREFRALTRLPA
jgi:sugar/nucleoside kinase (ribokinase family)